MLDQPTFLPHLGCEHSGIVSVRSKQPERTEPNCYSFPPMIMVTVRDTCHEFQIEIQLQEEEETPYLATITFHPLYLYGSFTSCLLLPHTGISCLSLLAACNEMHSPAAVNEWVVSKIKINNFSKHHAVPALNHLLIRKDFCISRQTLVIVSKQTFSFVTGIPGRFGSKF